MRGDTEVKMIYILSKKEKRKKNFLNLNVKKKKKKISRTFRHTTKLTCIKTNISVFLLQCTLSDFEGSRYSSKMLGRWSVFFLSPSVYFLRQKPEIRQRWIKPFATEPQAFNFLLATPSPRVKWFGTTNTRS